MIKLARITCKIIVPSHFKWGLESLIYCVLFFRSSKRLWTEQIMQPCTLSEVINYLVSYGGYKQTCLRNFLGILVVIVTLFQHWAFVHWIYRIEAELWFLSRSDWVRRRTKPIQRKSTCYCGKRPVEICLYYPQQWSVARLNQTNSVPSL